MKYFIAIVLSVSIISAQPDFPVLQRYATDLTNTITGSQINSLDNQLRRFDDTTSNQVLFLMNSTIDGYPIEMYTYEVATKNKLGSKENNNGVLFFVAKDDRKMRIEVGYGLEGTLPDALASSIIRNDVAPFFKQGDYYSGVQAGISSIISATKGEYKREDRREEDEDSDGLFWIYLIFLLIFLIFGKKGKGGLLGAIILGNAIGGGRSSGSFGGGSFGGFSGGGGSFGGGGASGGW